jgi:single-strand DNA-binding protein
MYKGINKVDLFGRVDKDPELRSTNNGKSVANFTLIVETFTDFDGKEQKYTEYARIVAWGKQAENAHKLLSAGSWAFVTGRQSTRTWEDRQGQKQKTTEVVVTDIIPVGEPIVGNQSSGQSGAAPQPADDDSPLPF